MRWVSERGGWSTIASRHARGAAGTPRADRVGQPGLRDEAPQAEPEPKEDPADWDDGLISAPCEPPCRRV